MIGIKKERKLEKNRNSELSYRSSNYCSKRRVVRGLNARSFSVLEQTACRLALRVRSFVQVIERHVVRMYRTTCRSEKEQTTCRSYVSDDLSFGEGANDVSFQLPDDQSFGSTELIFLHLSKRRRFGEHQTFPAAFSLFLLRWFLPHFSSEALSLLFSLTRRSLSPISLTSSPVGLVAGGKPPLLSPFFFSHFDTF